MAPDLVPPREPRRHDWVVGFVTAVDRCPSACVAALTATGVLIVALLQYMAPPQLTLDVVYLAPVAMAAWHRGLRTGVAAAVLAVAAWFVVSRFDAAPDSEPLISLWNVGARFATFIIVVYILAALRRLLREAEAAARTDPLTGLANVRAFGEALAQQHARLARGEHCALALVDLDDFKRVNDEHGHAAGDALLAAVGRALRSGVRRTDTAARVGGDEFALLLPGADEPPAAALVNSVHDALEGTFAALGLPVSASVGAVVFEAPPINPPAMLEIADAAMYQAKRAGKNRITIATYPAHAVAGPR